MELLCIIVVSTPALAPKFRKTLDVTLYKCVCTMLLFVRMYFKCLILRLRTMTQRRNRDKIRDIKGDPRSTTTFNYHLEELTFIHFNEFIILKNEM